jgi:hypothetical protein
VLDLYSIPRMNYSITAGVHDGHVTVDVYRSAHKKSDALSEVNPP